MPQPFVFRGGTIHVGPAALDGHQDLAAMIGLVAVHSAHLENILSRTFTVLIGGKQDVAFEIYHMLIDRELRAKTFLAAASVSGLPNDFIEDAVTLFKDIRCRSGERNAAVHGIWASIDGEDDSILLLDQKTLNNTLFKDISNIADAEWKHIKMTKYKQKDFKDIIGRLDVLSARAHGLYIRIFNYAFPYAL